MLHTMPDKTVRVTSRFPDGRSTVYFDLEHGEGFTLEQDRSRPELCLLRMLHGYRNFTARYGDPADAAEDFAELTTMLADRHCLPPPAPHALLPARSASSGAVKRKGWGWKGAVAGLAIGAVGAHFAPSWRMADTSAVRAAALGDALPRPGSGADSYFSPPPSGAVIPPSPALPPSPVAPARQQPASRPPASAPSFGLQQ